jgi:hypothetical protein
VILGRVIHGRVIHGRVIRERVIHERVPSARAALIVVTPALVCCEVGSFLVELSPYCWIYLEA